MKEISIAIVFYPGLVKEFFLQTVSDALSQVNCSSILTIYFEQDMPEWEELSGLNKEDIPKDLYNKPSGIRQYIVEKTNTPFLAFWDSDDCYTKNRLAEQVKILKSENAELCFSNFGFFDKNSIYEENFFDQIGFGKREINLLDENYVGLGICTGRTSFFRSLIPFPEIRTLDWWIAIKAQLQNARLCYSKEVLGYYRVQDNSLSSRFLNLSEKDFIAEKNNKIALYNYLDSGFPGVNERLNYLNQLDITAEYSKLKMQFNNNKYRNIWGGLIPYDKK